MKKKKVDRNHDQKMCAQVFMDVITNIVGVLLFIALLIAGSYFAGVQFLTGWTLVAALGLLTLVAIVAIAAVTRRRLWVRGQIAKDKFIDTNMD